MIKHLFEACEKALAEEAIFLTPTRLEVFLDYRIPFILRSPRIPPTELSNSEQKIPKKTMHSGTSLVERVLPKINPFLPYDPKVFVKNADTQRHVILLNKFAVVKGHALIVTKEFEFQLDDINEHDMQAAIDCLLDIDALVFYNCGKFSGASQPHKHLQLIPLPLVEKKDIELGSSFDACSFPESGLPIDLLIEDYVTLGSRDYFVLRSIENLGFLHVYCLIDDAIWNQPSDTASTKIKLLETYQKMLDAVKSALELPNSSPPHYNFLLTRRWMMLIPRKQEEFGGIPVNSLGFTGNLLVKSKEQILKIKQLGPVHILRQVTYEHSKREIVNTRDPAYR